MTTNATFARFLREATDADLRDALATPFVGAAGKAAIKSEQAARRTARRTAARKAS